jgi:hypothetical protein
MLVLLAFRGTERVIGTGGVDAGEAGGDEGFGEVAGLVLGVRETDVGVEALAVEDAFPAGEDGERSAAEEVRGEGAGVFSEGENIGYGEASEVAALIIDAAEAGGKALGFRAVDEVETEDVFFSGGGDAEAVPVVGAAADEAAVVELFPCVLQWDGWESKVGCAAIEVSQGERALQENGDDGEEREEQQPTCGADGGGDGSEAGHEVAFGERLGVMAGAVNNQLRQRLCKYGSKLKKGLYREVRIA